VGAPIIFRMQSSWLISLLPAQRRDTLSAHPARGALVTARRPATHRAWVCTFEQHVPVPVNPLVTHTWEQRLVCEQLSKDAAHAPHVHLGAILLRAQQQLRRPEACARGRQQYC
jgi:hypothetical protein